MHPKDIPALKIGNLEINPPIIQGGMVVVRVSRVNPVRKLWWGFEPHLSERGEGEPHPRYSSFVVPTPPKRLRRSVLRSAYSAEAVAKAGAAKDEPELRRMERSFLSNGVNLAATVANGGAVGVIASAGLGKFEDFAKSTFSEVNEEAFKIRNQERRKVNIGSRNYGINI